MYQRALLDIYNDRHQLIGVCDLNPGRVKTAQTYANMLNQDVKGYTDDQFDQMISELKPDTVIVTTKDKFHDEYICRSLALGCDVITEKPMTTTAEKCQRILDTQKTSGKQVRVTFNYRYSPPRTQVKDLLMSGIIGEVLSVDFHWLLDTRHGADYFRRWHRNKDNSGGLMVHKATHHFDLVNWWLSTVPEQVFATGQRKFYVPAQAEAYGLVNRGNRCKGCPESENCQFFLDMAEHMELQRLYLDNEHYDSYYRDRCVFSDEINIEDNMNVLVNYKNGVKMAYSLNAFMSWEGYLIDFNGTKGRLEHHCEESVYISGDGSVPGALKASGTTIKVFPHFKPAYSLDIWQAEGGHGGGDRLLLNDLFGEPSTIDKYKRAADYRSGAYSILTGIAANLSMAGGKVVKVDELVHGLDMPEYP
jgi:predicted dehydrogenase